MADRIKGLTGQHRTDVRLALREDTIVSENQNYPVRPIDLTVPSDGTACQWWHDVSQYGASMGAEGDVLEYRSSPGGIEFRESDNDRMKVMPGVANRNTAYWDFLLSGATSYSWAVRLQWDTDPSNFSFGQFLLTTGDTAKTSGDFVGWSVTTSDEVIFRARNEDSASNYFLLKTSSTYSVGTMLDCFAEVDVSGSTNTARLVVNGTEEDTASGFSLPGTTPIYGMTWNNQDDAHDSDFTAQGTLIDTEYGRGSAAIEWIRGKDYKPSSLFLEDTLSTYNEFQNLPSSPSDDDRVLYDPADGGKFLLEWDSNLSKWVCVSTGNEFGGIPITKNGGVNTDLFTISTDTSLPTVTVTNGKIVIDHDQASTAQNWSAKCKFGVRNAEVRIQMDANGSNIPSDGYAGVNSFLARNDRDLGMLGDLLISGPSGEANLKCDQLDDTGSFVTDYAQQNNVSLTSTHIAKCGANVQSFADETDWYAQTEISSGSIKTAGDTFTATLNDLNFGMGSNSNSNFAETPTFDIHSLALKV